MSKNLVHLDFFTQTSVDIFTVWENRSFSRDVIKLQNPKLKSYQSFYPHQAQEVRNVDVLTTCQLNIVLFLETTAF